MPQPQMIQFMRPVFPAIGEVFSTCRQGRKWFARAKVGETLYLVETGVEHQILGSAEVLTSAVLPLRAIPESWLKREHDETCRDHEGLLIEMRRVYGEYDEDYDTTVLLLLRTR